MVDILPAYSNGRELKKLYEEVTTCFPEDGLQVEITGENEDTATY